MPVLINKVCGFQGSGWRFVSIKRYMMSEVHFLHVLVRQQMYMYVYMTVCVYTSGKYMYILTHVYIYM